MPKATRHLLCLTRTSCLTILLACSAALAQATQQVRAPDIEHRRQSLQSGGSLDSKSSDGSSSTVPLLTIAIITTLMSLATALGAVPFFFLTHLTPSWTATANAVASGVMLACSFDLIHEGQPHSPTLVVTGIILGALFIRYSQRWLESQEDPSFDSLRGADARKVALMIGVMTLHAFGEGSGVGVSFAGTRGWSQGTLVSMAIGLHNIPEGLAVATVMASKGTPPMKTLMWTWFTALPQPLVAIPSYLFVESFAALLPLALGFAAGCMVWIVLAELVPEALQHVEASSAATAVSVAAAGMEGLRMLVAWLEENSSSTQNGYTVRVDTTTLLTLSLMLLPSIAVTAAVASVLSRVLAPPARVGAAVGVQYAMAGAALAHALTAGRVDWWELGVWAAGGLLAVGAVKWAVPAGGSAGGKHEANGKPADYEAGSLCSAHSSHSSFEPQSWTPPTLLTPPSSINHTPDYTWTSPSTSGSSPSHSIHSQSAHPLLSSSATNRLVATATAKITLQVDDGGAASLLPTTCTRSSKLAMAQRTAGTAAVACLASQCLAAGLAAAAGAAGNMSNLSLVVPPSVLLGVMVGLATPGITYILARPFPLMKPYIASIAAALLSALTALTATAALALYPSTVKTADGTASLTHSFASAADRLGTATSAAMIASCLGGLWPLARGMRTSSAVAGLGVGLMVGCLCAMGGMALCTWTPYCLY